MSCKIGRKTVCYTLQGLSKINMSCKHKNFKLKMFTIKLEILSKKFHPYWVSSCHPFDDVGRVEFVSNHLLRPLYLHLRIVSHPHCDMDGSYVNGQLIQRLISHLHGWMLKYRCHQVEYTFPLKYGGHATYMKSQSKFSLLCPPPYLTLANN